jgi:multiple sugar transport system substrate-binding protein
VVSLRGMTWDHARGYDPMVATSAAYSAKHPGVTITWEKRSLQAFADRPISEMAETYDLMVIDHPHVGEVAKQGNLLPLDGLRDAEMAALAAGSVGLSHPSYNFAGRQWSLAIDTATPVACLRPDLLGQAPKLWAEVLDLARAGRVGFALIPINALMTFFGMAPEPWL